ncbi:unnamed protein product [Prorocentrum cordatum]|uniref:Uncharacterized protein n=1 Tax=Prorocentrum cordatum TaxID=2364126 RepID=A0ABN9VIS2_9DINO|nr:unnamed protein product [Polarella glacialis]
MSRSRCTCHSSPTAPPTRRGWPRPCCTAPAGLGPITLTWLRVHCSDARLGQREEKERLLQRVYPQLRLLDVNVSRETPDISWIKPLAFQQLLGDTAASATTRSWRCSTRTSSSCRSCAWTTWRRTASCRWVRGQHLARAPCSACRAWCSGTSAAASPARPTSSPPRYMPFDHFMISDMRVHLPYPTEQHPPDPTHGHEGWPWVERFMATEGGDACAARVGHGDAPRRLPTFLHTVRPWNPEQQNTSWQFSKYQVPPGWSRQDGEGILDCDMPLLAEPARDYVRVVGETPLPHPNRTQVRAARRRRLEAWTMCGIIHGLNDMLMDVKKLKCPQGFNDRRALKIEGHWNNRLLEPYAPEGGDAESVRRCSVGLTCTRGIAPLGGDGQPAGQHSFAARGGQRAAAPLL